MKKQNKSHVYFGYNARVIFSVIMYLLFSCIFIISFSKTFFKTELKSISYIENSDLDYKVFLKENDIYDEEFLSKDMSYVASLIKSINTKFYYKFKLDQEKNIKFSYDIIGKLVITDENNKTYFEKDYTLLNNKIVDAKNGELILNEEINIDYDYYNDISNKFKVETGVSTNSNFIVKLIVKKESADSSELYKLDNSSEMYINIPLSEKSINIKMDYKDINNKNYIYEKEKLSINDNIILLIVDILSFIFLVFSLVKVIKLLSLLSTRKSKYDKYIKKLLSDYDRLIVITDTIIDLSKYNVTMVHNFNELVDIRDNLKTPIFYCSLQEHVKSYFYIKNNDDLYLVIIKAVDLEN